MIKLVDVDVSTTVVSGSVVNISVLLKYLKQRFISVIRKNSKKLRWSNYSIKTNDITHI